MGDAARSHPACLNDDRLLDCASDVQYLDAEGIWLDFRAADAIMESIDLKDSMKLIFNILKESQELARRNLATARQAVVAKDQAVEEFAMLCAQELGVDTKTHVLELNRLCFIPRPKSDDQQATPRLPGTTPE